MNLLDKKITRLDMINMIINKQNKMIKFNKTHYLLIIGILVAPMTQLRISKVGLSEIFILLWAVINAKNFKINFKDETTKFWLYFIPLIFISNIYGYLKYSNSITLSEHMTYLFFAGISILLIHAIKNLNTNILFDILYRTVILFVIIYLSIYIASFISLTDLFGVKIWFGDLRFSPGTDNPHQFAMPAAIIGFLSLFMINKTSLKRRRIMLFVSFVISLFLGFETKASTYILTVVLSFIYLFLMLVNKKINDRKKILIFLLILLAMILAIIPFDIIQNSIIKFIESDVNGEGRIDLIKDYRNVFIKSPIIGLGPGNHAYDGYMEFHNTYIEILAMSGILGMTLFVLFNYRIFKLTIRNKKPIVFIFLLIPLIYGVAGFAFRRTFNWLAISFVIGFLNISKNDLRKEVNYNGRN